MILMNCTQCDDMVVLLGDRQRSCLCGRCTGRLPEARGSVPATSGPARLAEIPWEAYDMASGGDWQRWRILPKRGR